MSINRVCLSGNLTRDPELRATSGGTSVLSFGMAVNDRRKNPQTQQWEDYPNFVDCTIFGNRAQSLSTILRKGMKVAIEGRLHYSSWESNGQKRSRLDVTVDEVELMTSRDQRQGSQQSYGGGYQQPAQQQGYQQQGYAQQQPAQGYAATVPPAAPPAPVAPAPPTPQQTQAWSGQQQPPSRDVYDEDIPF